MCQEGANSGLKTCRLASSRTVAVVIMIASQAAGATIVDGARILPLCISVISRYQALDVRSRVHQDTSPIRRHLISLLPRGWPKVVKRRPRRQSQMEQPRHRDPSTVRTEVISSVVGWATYLGELSSG